MGKRSIVAAILLYAAFGVGSAQSQQPPIKGKKPKTEATERKGADEQRGTENAPVVVKALPAEKGDKERADEAAERDEKRALDRRLVDLTSDLARSTDDLASFTKALFYATAVLGIGTCGLLWLGFRQSKDTRVALALARDEFNATHRPKLRVRLFRLQPLTDGRSIMLSFAIVNVGDTAACLQRMEPILDIEPLAGTGKPEPQALGNPFTPGHKIIGGAQYVVGLGRDADIEYNHLWQIGRHPSASLTVSGTIEYSDDNRVVRRTAFRRTFVQEGRDRAARFFASSDPDDEYED